MTTGSRRLALLAATAAMVALAGCGARTGNPVGAATGTPSAAPSPAVATQAPDPTADVNAVDTQISALDSEVNAADAGMNAQETDPAQ